MEIISRTRNRFAIIILLLILKSQFSDSAIGQHLYTSANSGDWNAMSSWTSNDPNHTFPGDGDEVLIYGHIIDFNTNLISTIGLASLEMIEGSITNTRSNTYTLFVTSNRDITLEGNIDLGTSSSINVYQLIVVGKDTQDTQGIILGIDENSSISTTTNLNFSRDAGSRPILSNLGAILAQNLNLTDITAENFGSISVTENLTLLGSGDFIIKPSGTVTINGTTNNFGNSFQLLADETNTGSLIARGAVSGTVLAQSVSPAEGWQILSPRVSSELVTDFLLNNSIFNNTINIGLGVYNVTSDVWSFFPCGYSGGNTLESGKGYAVLKNRNVPDDAAPNTVKFEGLLLSGPQSSQISSIGNGWNAIGIPYPSAILADLFIAANEGELSDAFAGIYLWENGAWRSFIAGSGKIIQSGQGFLIKAKPGATSVIFQSSMQRHNTTTSIKSTSNNIYKIDLIAQLNELEKNTSIYFRENMSRGLDICYDVGLRKVDINFELYSKLINGYPEVDFEHQTLPDNDLDQLMIPIGLDCTAGGKVSFLTSEIKLPYDVEAFLYDKQEGTLSNLTSEGIVYTTEVQASTYGEGRFYIYMKAGSGSTSIELDELLSVKAFYNSYDEIQIEGELGYKAVASIFDISGKLVGYHMLKAENINMIPVGNLEEGIYILRLTHGDKVFKTTIPIQ